MHFQHPETHKNHTFRILSNFSTRASSGTFAKLSKRCKINVFARLLLLFTKLRVTGAEPIPASIWNFQNMSRKNVAECEIIGWASPQIILNLLLCAFQTFLATRWSYFTHVWTNFKGSIFRFHAFLTPSISAVVTWIEATFFDAFLTTYRERFCRAAQFWRFLVSFQWVQNRVQAARILKNISNPKEPGPKFSRIFQLKSAQNQPNSTHERIQRPFNTYKGKIIKIYGKEMRLPFPLWSSRSGWGQGAFWDISTRLNSKTDANFSSIALAGVDWGKSKL